MALTEAASKTATFTPAAATYSANTVMDTAKEFPDLGPKMGGTVMITCTRLEIDAAALISGEAGYRLHLYKVTPPSAHADQVAWDLPSGDRAAYLGFIDLGTPVDLGSTLWVEQQGVNKQIKVPGSVNGGSIWGELMTVGGFTATAVARKVSLEAVWL